MRKIKDLNEKELENFIQDYYDATITVKEALQKHLIDEIPSHVSKQLPPEKSSMTCPFCNAPMFSKMPSKTEKSYRYSKRDYYCQSCNHIVYNSPYSKCSCDNCKAIRYQELETMKKKQQETLIIKKKNLLSFIESHTSNKHINLNMGQRNLLLTLITHLLKDDLKTLKPISSMNNTEFPFSPTDELISISIKQSLCSIINFSPLPINIDILNYSEEGHITYKFMETYYQLNGHFLEMKTNEIIDELSNPEYYENIMKEALEYWKQIAYHELLEYLYFLMQKYNLDIEYIKDAIKEKIQNIIEHFSVSQGMSILYTAIRSAAAYSQESNIYMKRAVNSIVSRIENGISKRLAGNWKSDGYARNYDLPRSALAMCFFDRIIKIGDKGFTEKPDLIHLNHLYSLKRKEIKIQYPYNKHLVQKSLDMLKDEFINNLAKELSKFDIEIDMEKVNNIANIEMGYCTQKLQLRIEKECILFN